MTPKEKAQELINRMYYTQSSPTIWTQAKDCALIAVDEIRQLMNKMRSFENAVYWKEVKQEIEKL
jgi:hypothetical protein